MKRPKLYKFGSPGHHRSRQEITLTKIKREIKENPKLRKQYRLAGLLK